MKFSERHGYKNPKIDILFDQLDEGLRIGLLNIHLRTFLFNNHNIPSRPINEMRNEQILTLQCEDTLEIIWADYFNKLVSDIPRKPKDAISQTIEMIQGLEFPEVYDFLEFASNQKFVNVNFRANCNLVLEQEKSAFRFVGNQLSQIISSTEIAEIEKAQNQQASNSVTEHINTAVSLYSDRENPDYRNSIKESISAVEAAARELAGPKVTKLGEALKILEEKGVLQTAQKEGYLKLYGWTSGKNGIRHALMEKENLGEADARYMLVSCSAFANYLLSHK